MKLACCALLMVLGILGYTAAPEGDEAFPFGPQAHSHARFAAAESQLARTAASSLCRMLDDANGRAPVLIPVQRRS